jgi:hypothetical protein
MVLHSGAEFSVALLALFHPAVWEIKEQKALWPVPRPHPLTGHPSALGLDLPPFQGTLDVAERLGGLKKHPRVNIAEAGMPPHWVPQFWVGDLLVFCCDAAGPYCVNLSIKKSPDGFRTNPFSRRPRAKDQAPDPKVKFRQEAEALYYADAGIRTVEVTPSAIDSELQRNLASLHPWVGRPFSGSVSKGQEAAVLEFANRSVGSALTLYGIALESAHRFAISPDDAKIILKSGIWRQQLRVNLYSSVLDDQPLRPQKRDPVIDYAHLFSRGGA